ncbi:MAG TPA: secretin N-terminal domain-containing protein, partial [Caulobacter sp.]|nr:secretin N-terminal domain-containing protein [Caulobacter sp.]
ALQSARTWIGRLDRAEALGGRTTTFVYQVRNTDAASVAALISAARGEDQQRTPADTGQPGQPPQDTASQNDSRGLAASAFGDGRMAVDESGNRIVFTGSAEDFMELRGLMVALDTPRPQVLVEVTVAEVTLTDETRVGLEWFFTRSMSNGQLEGGTKGGLGLDTGGLTLKFTGTDVQAAFNAFASNNKVNILSRPRLVARSGDEARIQVGTDVPIITSRANSPTQTGGSSDILQTIQYRQTGVILTIRPVIYSDGRVDLQITQEVSSQQPNSNTAIGSPLILNRSVTTRLSVDEGATAVIGGLIDDNYTKGNSGIPLLKDIPLLGAPFRVDSFSTGKTELIILVTPHILRDGGEMAFWTQRSTADMNAAFAVGRGWSYTLTPFTAGQGLRIDPAPVAAPR